jgi:hypothetical protein
MSLELRGGRRNHVNNAKDYSQTDDFSTAAWELKISVQKNTEHMVDDWKVLDLLKGVVNMPLGANKRHLTLAIEHARAHNEKELRLKELSAYIKTHAIGHHLPDMVAIDKEHPDVVARQAFEKVVAPAKREAIVAARRAR